MTLRHSPRRKYERECRACGKTFRPWDAIQPYCSRACAAVGRTRPREACPVCSEPVALYKTYCSKRCEGIGRTKPRPHCNTCDAEISPGSTACNLHRHTQRRATRQRTCPRCSVKFIPYPSATLRGSGKFCSRACYAAEVGKRLAMLNLQCPQCGSPFRRTRAAVMRVKASYCSYKCATEAHTGEGSVQWRGGSDPNRGQGWRKIAESVRERDGYRCRRCGKTQEQNRQKLSVDHVIPWRSFDSAEEANQLSNLVTLCRPCHSRKGRAERLWLQGDVLDMWRYQTAVAQPWPESRS